MQISEKFEMPNYANRGGDSGIVAYESGPDWIEVEFTSGAYRFYKYTYASAGSGQIEVMKKLAADGHGLNSYINTTV